MASTEDKQHWVDEYGVKTELRFLQTLSHHGIDAIINPDKRHDGHVHDLSLVTWPGELKTVETPLFKAKANYGFDPQFTVTLNHKDTRHYEIHCPHVMIFFHVVWQKEVEKVIGGTRYAVKPMQGVWMVWFPMFQYLLETSPDSFPTIEYERRRDDENGNAKESYVFDVRLFPRLFRKFLEPEPVNGKVVGPARNDLATHRL